MDPITTNQKQQADTLARMEMWVARKLGDYPYIGTKEEYEKLPDIAKQEIIARFPEHAEYLAADPSKLPAELLLRMEKKQLLFQDQEALERAGYVHAVQYLSKAQKQYMVDAWEASVEADRVAAVANEPARKQEMARLQAESLERSNSALRAGYVRQLHSGNSVEQPAGLG